MDADQIIKIIQNNTIRVVSFSLFDTLFTVPGVYLGDIFALLREGTPRQFGADSNNASYATEEELIEEHEELLLLRRDVKRMYDAAVASGKRIIVTSRLYLREEAVQELLRRKGFGGVAGVYTPVAPQEEENADSFYDAVLAQENISAAELLHIDSDYDAGYKIPFKKGITAVYYPSVVDIALRSGSPWGEILKGTQYDPIMRVHYSFAFLYAWNTNDRLPEERRFFRDPESFSYLFLAPLLTAVATNILVDHSDWEKNPSDSGTDHSDWEKNPSDSGADESAFLPRRIFDILWDGPEADSGEKTYVPDRVFETELTGHFMKDAAFRDVINTLSLDFAPVMNAEMQKLVNSCLLYASAYAEVFSKHYRSMKCQGASLFTDMIRAAFIESPYQEATVFDDLFVKDKSGKEHRLSKVLFDLFEEMDCYADNVQGTAFLNPDYIMHRARPDHLENISIGMHLHLYNTHLISEIIGYLKTIRYHFDLFVTITDRKIEPVLKSMLTAAVVPPINRVSVIVTENRGRDVAPWLIEMGGIQNDYDLFCHIHSKESPQYGNGGGAEWRHYLFDNLISGDAVKDMVAMFASDTKLGIVFPKPFSPILNVFRDNRNVPVYGGEKEKELIRELLDKMDIHEEFSRDNYIFSVGTMLWYRPNALRPMFEIGLSYKDFPEEPIDVAGTIAHAIERLPQIVARSRGYLTGMFNEVDEADSMRAGDVHFGYVYPGSEDFQDRAAWKIGVRQAVKVVHFANVILVKKIFRKKTDEQPDIRGDVFDPYRIAQITGVRGALRVLRKAIGISILKRG